MAGKVQKRGVKTRKGPKSKKVGRLVKNFLKDNWGLVTSLVLILVLIIIISVFSVKSNKSSTEMFNVIENLDNDDKDDIPGYTPEYILYYAPWCGHCKSVMPHWDKLGPTIKNSTGQSVKVKKINCDIHKDIAKQQGIDGFPTIKYHHNNKSVTYNGERSHEKLKEFVSKQ